MSEQKKEGLSIRGRVMLILPEEIITKKDGSTLVKKQFVIETIDQYPKKVSFQAISDKVNVPKIGTVADFHFNIESREYQGRWYSQVTCWKIWEERGNNSAPSNTPNAPMSYPQQPHETNFTNDDGNDTLPF
jgi:hypothetical protein